MHPSDDTQASPSVPPRLGLSEALLVESSEDKRSELDKIMEMILDPRNIGHNTELTGNEIKAFSALRAMVNKYQLPMLKEYLVERMVLGVSKGRKGRGEWVKLLSRGMTENSQLMQQQAGGMMRRNGWFRR